MKCRGRSQIRLAEQRGRRLRGSRGGPGADRPKARKRPPGIAGLRPAPGDLLAGARCTRSRQAYGSIRKPRRVDSTPLGRSPIRPEISAPETSRFCLRHSLRDSRVPVRGLAVREKPANKGRLRGAGPEHEGASRSRPPAGSAQLCPSRPAAWGLTLNDIKIKLPT